MVVVRIRCPACKGSGGLCSTCYGEGFMSDEGPYDLADDTETNKDWRRVRRDQARTKRKKTV